jgi:hypothetical protein
MMISNLVSGCVSFYNNWFEELSSVALTKVTAKEIFDAHNTEIDDEDTRQHLMLASSSLVVVL